MEWHLFFPNLAAGWQCNPRGNHLLNFRFLIFNFGRCSRSFMKVRYRKVTWSLWHLSTAEEIYLNSTPLFASRHVCFKLFLFPLLPPFPWLRPPSPPLQPWRPRSSTRGTTAVVEAAAAAGAAALTAAAPAAVLASPAPAVAGHPGSPSLSDTIPQSWSPLQPRPKQRQTRCQVCPFTITPCHTTTPL